MYKVLCANYTLALTLECVWKNYYVDWLSYMSPNYTELKSQDWLVGWE